jgi:hypothetical protein
MKFTYLTIINRGITTSSPRVGNPNNEFIGYVSIYEFNEVHPNDFDPGHLYP